MRERKSAQSGVSLLEMAIFILITGIFLGAAVEAYRVYDEKRRFEVTELRLSDIETAINNFAAINGRLPCAAPRNVARETSAYGREENCKFSPSNTVSVSGQGGKQVRIGLLPARTLGISDTYMLDGYGNALTYAVTEDLADKATYSSSGGAIDVLDSSGTSRLSAVNYAQYIVVSAGETGHGAYSAEGVSTGACDTSRMEGENCDDNAIFVDTDRAQGSNAGYYDDFTMYRHLLPVTTNQSGTEGCQQITGEYFYQTCPDGWSQVSEVSAPSSTLVNALANRGASPNSDVALLNNATQDPMMTYDQNFFPKKLVSFDDGSYFIRPLDSDDSEYQSALNNAGGIKYCRKDDSNGARTKCFTEKFAHDDSVAADYVSGRAATGGYAGGQARGCPEGYMKIGSKAVFYQAQEGANDPANSSTNTYKVPICGKI